MTLFRCGGHCFTSLVSHYFGNVPCKNYNCILMFVKVMPKQLATVFFCNFNKFVFQNSQGNAETQLKFGGNVICTLLEILCAFQW